MANNHATPVGATAIQLLKALGVFPVSGAGTLGSDGIWHTLTLEQLPFRGGSWSASGLSGVFALNLNNARSAVSASIGSRPAFVL